MVQKGSHGRKGQTMKAPLALLCVLLVASDSELEHLGLLKHRVHIKCSLRGEQEEQASA